MVFNNVSWNAKMYFKISFLYFTHSSGFNIATDVKGYLTLSPGKAISGLETAAILARAWLAFTFPFAVPSRANGIKACRT